MAIHESNRCKFQRSDHLPGKSHFKSDFRLRNRDKVERVAMSLRRLARRIDWRWTWLKPGSPGLITGFLFLFGRYGMCTGCHRRRRLASGNFGTADDMDFQFPLSKCQLATFT